MAPYTRSNLLKKGLYPGKMANQSNFTEAIVLAGGRGTRLQSLVSDVPKPMADVGGRPFLTYVLDYLITQGITRVILSVGYKRDVIQEAIGESYRTLEIVYAIENEPLGTGGAILNSLILAKNEHVWVLNGDTFLPVTLQKVEYIYFKREAVFSLLLREVVSDGRYGGVELDGYGTVTGFTNKGSTGRMQINAGTYLVNQSSFKEWAGDRSTFSLEDDFFTAMPYALVGIPTDAYFIDIGIPEDYLRAKTELPNYHIPTTYNTLFLDRDGVLNKRIIDGYVTNWNEFEFVDGVFDALKSVSSLFQRIIVLTNQRGVSRALMTEQTVNDIHNLMSEQVALHEGRIDKVYACTCEDCTCRKPDTGMALAAQRDCPTIDFAQSIMIGDSLSDLLMAKKLGIKAIYIVHNHPIDLHCITIADEVYNTLYDWSLHYTKQLC